MAKMNFKFSIEDIHSKANRLVNQYREEDDQIIRDFIVSDLINLTEELVRNNVHRFKVEMNAPEVDDEEAFALCMGSALFQALRDYDVRKGVHFTTFWHGIMTGVLLNEFKRVTTNKEKMLRNHTISGNATYTKNEGDDLFSVIPSEEAVDDSICNRMVLDDYIERFKEIEPFGKLIECEFLGNKSDRTQAILNVLGVDSYGSRERQIVRRTKIKFKKFLLENDFEIDHFI